MRHSKQPLILDFSVFQLINGSLVEATHMPRIRWKVCEEYDYMGVLIFLWYSLEIIILGLGTSAVEDLTHQNNNMRDGDNN